MEDGKSKLEIIVAILSLIRGFGMIASLLMIIGYFYIESGYVPIELVFSLFFVGMYIQLFLLIGGAILLFERQQTGAYLILFGFFCDTLIGVPGLASLRPEILGAMSFNLFVIILTLIYIALKKEAEKDNNDMIK